ncbi:MAG: DNA-binding protein [Candidatus Odinarchaeota archaeon]|nr:DNA-binding protein [Candidatus Odinarchaeota archaeon]
MILLSEDEELEEIQRRKLLELQRQIAEARRREEMRRQLEMQKQAILRRILSSEARERLTRIKMVRPEFAERLELELIRLAQAGRLPIPLSDDQLKMILKRLQGGRRETKIKFR